MVKFTDEHKKDMSGDSIPEGIHKVKIMLATFDKTDDGKEFVEFTVVDEEEREGKARMWFTTDKAIGYTFGMIRAIFVHNAPEAKKDEVRTKFDAIEDTEALEKACAKVLIGKEAWYKSEKDPSRTWTDNDGNQRASYNRNIYGYEPSPSKVSSQEAKTEPLKTKNAAGEDIEIAEF